MSRKFIPSLIEIRNNPFSSTKSVSISTGTYMKDSKTPLNYIPHTDPFIEMGILEVLRLRVNEIEDSNLPGHVLILADYGQGKSFALKKIQDDVYIEHNGALLCYSIGGAFQSVQGDDLAFRNSLMEDIENLFQDIDELLYTHKVAIQNKYQLTTHDKSFNQFLEAYDNAFRDLGIPVYIIIDELDKVVISDLSDDKVRIFLEDLKSISDNCNRSISLIVAGTPNCRAKIDNLSIDYNQRFEIIEINFLTPEETADYIYKKCKSKLSYAGYFPFDSWVRKRVFNLTGGNIRRIESLCRELWNFSVREKKLIDNIMFNKYFATKLRVILRNNLPVGTSETIINFMIDMFVRGGKIGASVYLSKLSNPKRNSINQYLIENITIKQVGRSLILSSDYKEILAEALIN